MAQGQEPRGRASTRVRLLLARVRHLVGQRRTRWATAGVVLLAIGVLAVGAGLGWAGRSLVAPSVAAPVEVDVVAAPDDDIVGASRLPDVRGLALAAAQQAVVDAGVDPATVTVVEVPSALPGGTVVSQDPVGGTGGASAVMLSVAVPGEVPALVGTDGSAAVQTLLELGVTARVVQVYEPTATVGAVLAIEPPPGSSLTRYLTVTVAGPPGSLFLTDMRAEQSACGSGDAGINGVDHPESLLCGAGSTPRTSVYLLNRVTAQLTGTAGILDTSDLGYQGRVVVRGDGVELFSADLQFGTEVPFTVSTAGVLQLQIEVIRTGEDDYTVDGQVALGDIRVVGSPDAVAGLADR